MSKIENWTLISLGANNHYQITGQVYGDHRCGNGDDIRTSSLKSIDFEKGKAQTLNTLYDLGDHADGTVPLGKPIEPEANNTAF